MKYTAIALMVILTVFACQDKPEENNIDIKETETMVQKDTTPRVTGVGGVFFRSENPDDLTKWYKDNLGIKTDAYGAVFESRNSDFPDEINYLRWSAFPEETDYFDPSTKDFMINYRCQNIEGLVRDLKASGVNVVDEIQEYEYGKFVHLMDPEGNKIELWEPVDSVLTEMGGETNK